MQINEWEWFHYFGSRIVVATICGLIVGWERELKSKVAGIRTNVLVCVGSAILTSIAYIINKEDPNADPGRIIGQIVTGVGFLGGGVIFKMNDRVTGVTTASFIWIMCALGILAGMGFVYVPIVCTAGLIILSLLFHILERRIEKSINEKNAQKNQADERDDG
ncbi:MAG: MgtC/SapB family protein [Sphingobacteriales bacterium JAD_PAG50586_3]|nr:MAG: MgtC/SapB family protein [Sphingobacteriales bacterium JAD_PAG50586_3]